MMKKKNSCCPAGAGAQDLHELQQIALDCTTQAYHAVKVLNVKAENEKDPCINNYRMALTCSEEAILNVACAMSGGDTERLDAILMERGLDNMLLD